MGYHIPFGQITVKQTDGKVDNTKAESFGCINRCLGTSVGVKTTPARSRALLGCTPLSSKCGFSARACTSGMGSNIAVIVQSTLQALKSTWDAKRNNELTVGMGLVPQLLGC